MEIRLRRDVVMNGSILAAGTRLAIDRAVGDRLLRAGRAERVDVPEPADFPEAVGDLRDVLVFTAVAGSGRSERLEGATVAAVLNLHWGGSISWLFQRDNPHGYGRESHLHQYRRAREIFLAGSWEGMLVVESDIVPPADALVRLAGLGVDAAYGLYVFRHSNLLNVCSRRVTRDNRVLEGESLSRQPQLLRRAREAGRVESSGGGLGCVLLRRRVLAGIDFRLERTGHCDMPFNRDILTGGFSQAADMGVVCGHVDESGRVWRPAWEDVRREE